jgi:hypothetical protein
MAEALRSLLPSQLPVEEPAPEPNARDDSARLLATMETAESGTDKEPVTAKTRKALVWSVFKDCSKEGFAECAKCNRLISHKGGSTGAMKNHATGQHKDLWDRVVKGHFHVDGSYNDVATRSELERVGGRSPEKVREYIVRFCVNHSEPYRVVEDKYFRDLLLICGLDTPVPGRESIRTDVLKWHLLIDGKLKDWIHSHVPGKVSLTFDCWTSPNLRPFLSMQIHWLCDKWQKKTLTLAFKPLGGRHTGEVLLKVLSDLMLKYDLHGHLHCITTDNGSDNLKALRMFSENFDWDRQLQIRCLAHALNLCCKVLIEHPIVDPVRKKVKRQFKEILTGGLRCEDFASLAEERGVQLQSLSNDNVTRWGSTYKMLQSAYACRNLFDDWNREVLGSAQAESLHISLREWNLVADCLQLLQPFAQAQVEVQSDISPTLPVACGLYEWLLQILEKDDLPESLAEVIPEMQDKLEKYFAETSDAYYVATMLDPRLKLCWAAVPKRKGQISYKTILAKVQPFLEPYLKDPPTAHPTTVPGAVTSPLPADVPSSAGALLEEGSSDSEPPLPSTLEGRGFPEDLLLVEQDFALDLEDEEEEIEMEPSSALDPSPPRSGGRKRKARSKEEKLQARRAQMAVLEEEHQRGVLRSFQDLSNVNPVLGWLATVPTVDAVQERKKQKEAERSRRKGVHPELAAYLMAEPAKKDQDPLLWWKTIGQAAYPNLAKAARNFLAVPATTASSERNFSEGRQVIAWTRHQLRDQMIEANMCLKSWFEFF